MRAARAEVNDSPGDCQSREGDRSQILRREFGKTRWFKYFVYPLTAHFGGFKGIFSYINDKSATLCPGKTEVADFVSFKGSIVQGIATMILPDRLERLSICPNPIKQGSAMAFAPMHIKIIHISIGINLWVGVVFTISAR